MISRPFPSSTPPRIIPRATFNNGNRTKEHELVSIAEARDRAHARRHDEASSRLPSIPFLPRGPASSPSLPASPSPSTNGRALPYSLSSSSTSLATTPKPSSSSSSSTSPPPLPSNRFSTMVPLSLTEADYEISDIPLDTNFDWSKDTYNKKKRAIMIWSFVIQLRVAIFLLDQKWSYLGGFTDAKRSNRATNLAKWTRERLLQLGPTFIKLGQLFSTRADLLAPEFVTELSKLQDRVPAFSLDKVESIVKQELGASPSSLFASFDERPLAAASLGQVHRAVLKTGEQVVVKVQRPGLKALFDIDLEVLRQLAEQLEKQEDGPKDFVAIYEECASILYQEIDYIQEGQNADRFRRNFAGQNWIRVPKVYWQSSAPRVLTLEYLPGVKITKVDELKRMGLDTKMIARRATESYLVQILKHGFFHADPHPGNISIDSRGNLIFYDFGMMGTISNTVREDLLQVFYGIYRQDADAVTNALVSLKIIVPTNGDLVSIRRTISYFLQNLRKQTEAKEAVSKIGADLFAIALDAPFRFPAAFVFVLRAFSTLEGIGKALDSDFKFTVVATPYAQELLQLEDAQQRNAFVLEALQNQVQEVGDATVQAPLRIQRMEKVLGQIESGELKLRTRVLESERANRRASIMQRVTLHAVVSLGLLNAALVLATSPSGEATLWPAQTFSGFALLFAGLVVRDLLRVKRLDQFEKQIKGG